MPHTPQLESEGKSLLVEHGFLLSGDLEYRFDVYVVEQNPEPADHVGAFRNGVAERERNSPRIPRSAGRAVDGLRDGAVGISPDRRSSVSIRPHRQGVEKIEQRQDFLSRRLHRSWNNE